MLTAAFSCSHCIDQNCTQLIQWPGVTLWDRDRHGAIGSLQKQGKLSIGYEPVLVSHLQCKSDLMTAIQHPQAAALLRGDSGDRGSALSRLQSMHAHDVCWWLC